MKPPPLGKATDELTGESEAPRPEGEAEWTLDTSTAARARGMVVARSRVRRISRRQRVRWCRTRLRATCRDPHIAPRAPQGRASSRAAPNHPRRRRSLDCTCPDGDLYLVADNLASHNSGPIRDWLALHPRVQHAFIPVGAAWLNLIEGWWRLFRRKAFAGQSLSDRREIVYGTRRATAQLNRHATTWVGGRPPRPHHLRCLFVFRL